MARKKTKSTESNPTPADETQESGASSKRAKPAKKTEQVYPVRLTRKQRESMIHATRLVRKVKERLKSAEGDTQDIEFTRKELDSLSEELTGALGFVATADKSLLTAVLNKVDKLTLSLQNEPSSTSKAVVQKTAPKAGPLIYQFKITLKHTRPPIWRRIQVPDCTLAKFHRYIQALFGWDGGHLHEFIILGDRYSDPFPDDAAFGTEELNEREFNLSKLIPKSGVVSRWNYVYDFGDNWDHEIQFEGFVVDATDANYPICVAGKRHHPPEDCGGPWGYARILAALENPKSDEYEELMEWMDPFDPASFDPKDATSSMRELS